MAAERRLTMLVAPALARRAPAAMAIVLAVAALQAITAKAEPRLPELTLPLDCNLGIDCFVQQMPDIDPGPTAMDPLCGEATYDGHDGWDFRVRSMLDVASGVPVIGIADGRILRIRDGVADRIVLDGEEAEGLQGKECGNGVVMEHEGGLTSQYCHLKMGSIAVRPGMSVTRGTRLGFIGSSGLAQFPHVHLEVRHNGREIEPLTGRELTDASGCRWPNAGLFTTPIQQLLERPQHAILAAGLTDTPPTLPSLVAGKAPLASAGGPLTLAWVWAINLQEGDRFRIQIVHPDGSQLIDQTTDPLPRRKATYLAYAGSRRDLVSGTYTVEIDLLRAGVPATSMKISVEADG